ncbi:MAG: glycoside hydrolase family 9 protein [Ignavibacterium sp.]|nr:glycoside hydrolase family 9 protein [Ignavibacterium sp.]MDW8374919.1 glycoside hydrolase family 9 protein [Ignavibacteriales bacterium]
MKIVNKVIVSLVVFFILSCSKPLSSESFIRINQLGFRPEDQKTAILISAAPITVKEFVIKTKNDKTVFEKDLLIDTALNSHFKYSARLDFSEFKQQGEYYIQINNIRSKIFRIRNNIYNQVRDSLSLFFRVQRCGPTKPFLHQPCHLQDATEVIGYSKTSPVDLTGGWHDAGDYTKFLFTTAFTTYMMLFAYEFDPQKFNYDLDKNSVPDILEEARVGLDFLLRCDFADDAFITQVQDDRDHTVGWRMPENDTLTFNRPAFVKMNRSQIGIYAATMAIANRIWKSKFFDYEFAEKCLKSGIKIFELRDKIIDYKDEAKYYPDTIYIGELALGAAELFFSTNNKKYQILALEYGRKTEPDFWWSWGDFNALAFYKLSSIDYSFTNQIRKNLEQFRQNSRNNFFNEPLSYSWGTTTSFLGVALQAILYKKLTNNSEFDSLIYNCRDFVLGRNPWGMSFIYGIGHSYPKKIHSQIAYFLKGYLPGALVGGPSPSSVFEGRNIERNSQLSKFDYKNIIYFDSFDNYVNNEPTITGNVTALFVYGYFCSSNN